MRFTRRIRDIFYAGPRDLGVHLRGHSGYQSPTVTAVVWAYAWFMRYFTFSGRLVVLCCLLIVPYGLTAMFMPMHVLAFAVIALFAADLAAGLLFRPRLSVQREIPHRVSAGAEAQVAYTVTNAGSGPAWDLRLDSLPYPNSVKLVGGEPVIGSLLPGESTRRLSRIRAVRRGEFTVPAVRCTSGFPLYLWGFGTTNGHATRLLVHPSFTPLTDLLLPLGTRYQTGGSEQASNTGQSMEFLGCREFRTGDNPRFLHMRSWARTGVPVVKEFREEYLCRAAIVLDDHLPTRLFEAVHRFLGPRTEFEAALSLVAAISHFLGAQDFTVDLFAAGGTVYRFGGRSTDYQARMLDILAGMDCDGRDTFPDIVAPLAAELAQISGVVFVLLQWDEARRRMIEDTIASGGGCRAFLIVPSLPPPGLPPYVTPLLAGNVLAGRCTTL